MMEVSHGESIFRTGWMDAGCRIGPAVIGLPGGSIVAAHIDATGSNCIRCSQNDARVIANLIAANRHALSCPTPSSNFDADADSHAFAASTIANAHALTHALAGLHPHAHMGAGRESRL